MEMSCATGALVMRRRCVYGVADRLVRFPVGLFSRLMAWIGSSDLRNRVHFPRPSPNRPARPSAPCSSSRAEIVRALFAGRDRLTVPPVAYDPSSSRPHISTPLSSSSRLIMRTRLSWLRLLPGLTMDSQVPSAFDNGRSWTLVTNPSDVRTYASGVMTKSVSNSSRTSPSYDPMPADRPLSGLPFARSVELKWAAANGLIERAIGPWVRPESSTARTEISPPCRELLITRTNPSLSGSADSTIGASLRFHHAPVDRFVRLPVGLSRRLRTCSRLSDLTHNRHFPAPSPNRPDRRSDPSSSSRAVMVRDARGGRLISIRPSGAALPRSSMPTITTFAASFLGFTKRSRLTWLRLLPGLKNGSQ